MKKSVLLGLGGAAILGGWVLKSYLESRGSANVGENLVAANAKNSAQGEKETFKSKLGEFSQKQFKCDFGSENSSLSENFTHKEKMKMRDLEELQDEALQDRAWMQKPDQKSLDSNYVLVSAMWEMGLEELKDEFSTPYLLREQLVSDKLKIWLEGKIASCRKNEQAKSVYEDALQKLRKIPRNATRVEATKALYEIFMGEEASCELEKCFELEVRFHSLQAEGLNAIHEMHCLRQKIVENRDVGLCEQDEALTWYFLDLWGATTEILDNINPKGAINMDVKDETYIMHKMKEKLQSLCYALHDELGKLNPSESAKTTHFF